jgi:hypothetical protein
MEFFQFIAEHGLDLFKRILTFAGLSTVIASFLISIPAKPLNQSTILVQAGFSLDNHILLFSGIILFSMLSLILTINVSTIHAMSCYENEEPPAQEYILQELTHGFLRSIGAFLLLCITILIGCVFCIIPGVYVISAGTLLFPILRNKDKSIVSGLIYSIKMIRGHILKPIAFLLLISIITSIPSTALGFLSDLDIPYMGEYVARIITMINALISIFTLGMISVFGVILHKELLKVDELPLQIVPIK